MGWTRYGQNVPSLRGTLIWTFASEKVRILSLRVFPTGTWHHACRYLDARSRLIASNSPTAAAFGDQGHFALSRNRLLPDETAGSDVLDAGHHAAPMEDHRVEQIGHHAGVVRDDEELLADLRPGAGAIRQVDHAMFF